VVLSLLQNNLVLAQGHYAKGKRCALKWMLGMKTKKIPRYEEEVTVPRLFLWESLRYQAQLNAVLKRGGV